MSKEIILFEKDTLSITDKTGTHTSVIKDGEDGQSPTVTIDETVVNQHKIVFTDPDGTKHTTIVKDGDSLTDWVPDKAYIVGEIVIYGKNIYKCTTAHTSRNSFDDTEALNWLRLGSTDVETATQQQIDDLFK